MHILNRAQLSSTAIELIEVLCATINATTQLLAACDKAATGPTSPLTTMAISSNITTIIYGIQALVETSKKLPIGKVDQAITAIMKV